MKVMIERFGFLLCALTLTLFLSACSDPAADKEEAKVQDAVEIPETTEAGGEDAAPVEIEGTKYVMDPSISSITFTGSKVSGTHSGGWSKYECTVIVPDGDFTKAAIVIDFDMTSTFSDDTDLTDTLKSDKIFDVATYPTAKFVSTSIEGSDGEYRVSGNFTLHGVTKNITFTADVELEDDSLIAEADFSINRKDFNVNYDGLADDLIREKVVLLFYVEGSPAE
ncbi:MAG: YceI family protein [Candidatus Hydrogenedentota bacterium]